MVAQLLTFPFAPVQRAPPDGRTSPTSCPPSPSTKTPRAVGGNVTIGATAAGKQGSLTVTGRLNVKQDALCE